MKKQDNESLIQELTKRLDWYIMKASDEEFDADEVQTLMKMKDNIKKQREIRGSQCRRCIACGRGIG